MLARNVAEVNRLEPSRVWKRVELQGPRTYRELGGFIDARATPGRRAEIGRYFSSTATPSARSAWPCSAIAARRRRPWKRRSCKRSKGSPSAARSKARRCAGGSSGSSSASARGRSRSSSRARAIGWTRSGFRGRARSACARRSPSSSRPSATRWCSDASAARVAEIAQACRIDERTARERLNGGLSRVRASAREREVIMGCTRIDEDLVGAIDGTSSAELAAHVAGCDACRNARHEAQRMRAISRRGPTGRRARISTRASRRASAKPPAGASHARIRATQSSRSPRPRSRARGRPGKSDSSRSSSASRRSSGSAPAPSSASRPPTGRRARARRRPARGTARSQGRAQRRGQDRRAQRAPPERQRETIGGGSGGQGRLARRSPIRATRARIGFDDGTEHRARSRDRRGRSRTDPRKGKLAEGAISSRRRAPRRRAPGEAADAERRRRTCSARSSRVTVGPPIARASRSCAASVEIRGSGAPVHVGAGEEGVVGARRADRRRARERSRAALAFGEQLGTRGVHNEDTDAPVSGLGELRARKPGKHRREGSRGAPRAARRRRCASSETSRAPRSTRPSPTTPTRSSRASTASRCRPARRSSGSRSRWTASSSTASSSTAKAAAIWRGAIQNAAPKAPRPREEIIWVPGPWRDPGAPRVAARRALRAQDLPDPEARLAARRARVHADRRASRGRAPLHVPAAQAPRAAHRSTPSTSTCRCSAPIRRPAVQRARLRARAAGKRGQAPSASRRR